MASSASAHHDQNRSLARQSTISSHWSIGSRNIEEREENKTLNKTRGY